MSTAATGTPLWLTEFGPHSPSEVGDWSDPVPTWCVIGTVQAFGADYSTCRLPAPMTAPVSSLNCPSRSAAFTGGRSGRALFLFQEKRKAAAATAAIMPPSAMRSVISLRGTASRASLDRLDHCLMHRPPSRDVSELCNTCTSSRLLSVPSERRRAAGTERERPSGLFRDFRDARVHFGTVPRHCAEGGPSGLVAKSQCFQWIIGRGDRI